MFLSYFQYKNEKVREKDLYFYQREPHSPLSYLFKYLFGHNQLTQPPLSAREAGHIRQREEIVLTDLMNHTLIFGTSQHYHPKQTRILPASLLEQATSMTATLSILFSAFIGVFSCLSKSQDSPRGYCKSTLYLLSECQFLLPPINLPLFVP